MSSLRRILKEAGIIHSSWPFPGAAFVWVDSFILLWSDDIVFTQKSSRVLWNICLSSNWFSYKALSVVPQIPLMPPASQQCAEWLRSYTGHCLRRDWPFWWTTAYLTTRYVQGPLKMKQIFGILDALWTWPLLPIKLCWVTLSENQTSLSSLDTSG